MSGYHRSKGKRLELEAAAALTAATGHTWHRGARNGVRGAADVVALVPPYNRVTVEVKGRGTLALERWMQQCERAPGAALCLVLCREDRGEWIICARLSALHELIGVAHVAAT